MAPLYGSWVSSFLYPKRRVVRTDRILALAQADSCESGAKPLTYTMINVVLCSIFVQVSPAILPSCLQT